MWRRPGVWESRDTGQWTGDRGQRTAGDSSGPPAGPGHNGTLPRSPPAEGTRLRRTRGFCSGDDNGSQSQYTAGSKFKGPQDHYLSKSPEIKKNEQGGTKKALHAKCLFLKCSSRPT